MAKSCISLLHLLLKNGDFLNTDISQGNLAKRLGCGGVFVYNCYKFPTESTSERILKIGQYLVKFWARVGCLCFFDSRCTYGDSGVISMPGGFRRHLVGKTLIFFSL